MRPLNAVFVLLSALMFTAPAAAQNSEATLGAGVDTVPVVEPVAQVDAGDFRALAVSPDGHWLMVADAAQSQLRIYDLTDSSQPMVASPSLGGIPLDVVAGTNNTSSSDGSFAVVAVDLGDGTGEAQVIAPPSYDPSQTFLALTYIETSNRPRSLVLSPDGGWLILVGSGGWTLVELTTLEETSSTFYATPVNDALIIGDRALVAARNEQAINTVALSQGAQATLSRNQSIALDATASHLAMNQSGTIGAAALTNGEVMLFDLDTLDPLVIFNTGDVRDMHFLSFESGDWLVTLSDVDGQVHLYDVTDPTQPSDLGTLPLQSSDIQAITTYNDLIFVAMQSSVGIWRAAAGGVTNP
ncbi:MAG: WD40 repeat domain-containing protein [Anaerolineae bacterium]